MNDARARGTGETGPIEWMVFDLGNVVLYQTDGLPSLARRMGAAAAMTPAAFRDAYNAPRRDYDLHSDPVRYTGIRLAVLSNAPVSMGEYVRRQQWARLFDRIVISGEIGLIKPDAAIFAHLLRDLAAPADRVAFTDDLPENIAGAEAAGIRGIVFRGAGPLRSALAALGVPLP